MLGVIYSRAEIKADEFKLHSVEELAAIPSVVRDMQFFVQPKYRIAKDQPGSGNTKNIGAVSSLDDLVSGSGPFSELGEHVFDDYWMYYLTKDMARAVELALPPYTNLATYRAYKSALTEGEASG